MYFFLCLVLDFRKKMNSYENILGSAQTKFTKIVKKPEKFLKQDDEVFEDIKLLSKVREIVKKDHCILNVIQDKTNSNNCH